MSLISALNLGGSALAAQQAALQVTGNNISNVGNPNYDREVAELSPAPDQVVGNGILVGTGVDITAIQRQVDDALNERLRSSDSDQQAASTSADLTGQVQSVFNALGSNDLSSTLNTFFQSWSDLANNPSDAGQREIVLQDGQNVAQQLNSLNTSLTGLSSNVNDSLTAAVSQVNQLASQVASLNGQIVTTQAGGPNQANSLLDQRDADLQQLAQDANIQTVEQPTGSINVFIGSTALVSNTTSNSLAVQSSEASGQLQSSVAFTKGNTPANITGGQIGGLLSSQSVIQQSTTTTNALASNLIFELNKLHSSGQGLAGVTSTSATNQVTDPTQPLDSPASGLQFAASNGSFVIQTTDTRSGLSTSSLIQVHENSPPAADTTLNSLAASLNGVGSVSATVAGGILKIQSTNPNIQISFSQDSSGVLAALGINSFYTGTDASNIAVNSTLTSNPSLLAASANGNPDDNTTALAISNLGDTQLSGLNGATLNSTYTSMVESVGSTAANATNEANATQQVQQTLQAQQQNLSGVSTDEEAINMIQEQTAYQAAARLITAIDTMTQSLLAIT